MSDQTPTSDLEEIQAHIVDEMAGLEEIQAHIVDEMAGLEGIEKYKYLIDQGRRLDTGGGRLRREENRVHGCQSQVWIAVERAGDHLRVRADSDALIVRGIAALLVRTLSGQPPEAILNAELHFIDRTGLSAHLSPHRANGLAGMVDQIRARAAQLVQES